MKSEAQKLGQNGTCETVTIKADNARGFAIIDAEDFDSKVHKKYEEPKPEEAKKK
jgi:hypothetical protein